MSETASSGGGSALPAFASSRTAVPLSFSCKNHYLKSHGEFPPPAQCSSLLFLLILFYSTWESVSRLLYF